MTAPPARVTYIMVNCFDTETAAVAVVIAVRRNVNSLWVYSGKRARRRRHDVREHCSDCEVVYNT